VPILVSVIHGRALHGARRVAKSRCSCSCLHEILFDILQGALKGFILGLQTGSESS